MTGELTIDYQLLKVDLEVFRSNSPAGLSVTMAMN